MVIVPFVRWKKDNLKRIASHLRPYWLGILALIIVARIILTDNIYVLVCNWTIHLDVSSCNGFINKSH